MWSLREIASNRAHLLRVCAGVVAAVAIAVVLWVFRGEIVERIRAAGPFAYFAAMALVPLPLAWFTVPAGELFAAQLTVAGVIAAAMSAVIAQLSLSYAAARYIARPWLERWLTRRGHAVPKVTRENAVSMVLLVRLLPGPPMILGSCLLALGQAPFWVYLGLSSLVALPWVCAGVTLGRGIFDGNFTLAATGAGLLAAVVIAVRLFKNRWARRRPMGAQGVER